MKIGFALAYVGIIMIFIGGSVAVGISDQEKEASSPDVKMIHVFHNVILELGYRMSDKCSWEYKDVDIFLNSDPVDTTLKILIQTEGGKTYWTKDVNGYFKETIEIIPRERYIVSVINEGSKTVTFSNFEFNNKLNTPFFDREGNLLIDIGSIFFLVLIAGSIIMTIGVVIAKIKGEKFT